MKKITLIFITFGLFALSVFMAFSQSSADPSASPTEAVLKPAALAEVVYDGFQAKFVGIFAAVLNGLLAITAHHMIFAIILLALLVELILLYPSVRIQLKQKKIHLYHSHLIDLYEQGRLSYGQTEHEIHRLYDVNEKIHSRGALLVTVQMILFLAMFWGLYLIVRAPILASGSWSMFNISLLHKPTNVLVPVLVSLLYFLYALVKIYCKEREDYIAPSQTLVALLFALIGSTVIYLFAGTFALALSVYVATLITFSTIRYLVVEEHAREWGQLAQKELAQMLQVAEPHRDRFEYLSRKWNHFPVVRHLNFHLLEEALSMSLGLLLALNFFGVFQDSNAFDAAIGFRVPRAYAIAGGLGPRQCRLAQGVPNCSLALPNNVSLWREGQYYYAIGLRKAMVRGAVQPENFIPSCCLDNPSDAALTTYQVPFLREAEACRTVIQNDIPSSSCPVNQAQPRPADVTMPGPCPPGGEIPLRGSFRFRAQGGTGYYRWMIRDNRGQVLETHGDGRQSFDTFDFNANQANSYVLSAEDFYNELNNSATNNPPTSCAFGVRQPALPDAAPECDPEFGFYNLFGQPFALVGQAATKRVFPNTTYRFFVKNAVFGEEVEIADFVPVRLQEGAEAEGMLTAFNRGISEAGEPYVDIRFADDEDYRGSGGTLRVWDSAIRDGENICKATLHFEHLGKRIKIRTPKHLKISVH